VFSSLLVWSRDGYRFCFFPITGAKPVLLKPILKKLIARSVNMVIMDNLLFVGLLL